MNDIEWNCNNNIKTNEFENKNKIQRYMCVKQGNMGV